MRTGWSAVREGREGRTNPLAALILAVNVVSAAGSAVFRRKERLFSLVGGVALLGECVARVVGAYTVPVDTMVWLGSVITAGGMAVTFVASGRLAARPIERLLGAEMRSTGLECAGPKAGRAVPEVAFAA